MSSIETSHSKLFWLDHIRQWEQTELSQAAYCRQHDLCEQKFSYRKRQSSFAKVPVTVNSSTGFAHVHVDSAIPSSASASASGLSIRFSNGICIDGITENNLSIIPQLLVVLR